MKHIKTKTYRKDIDGLRAIAVISVILFHFGAIPNGYLGVDVFFVISGYLITGIIYRELDDDRFSIVNFYLRRTRRILPLTSFIVFLSLAFGAFVMLPDDLENLAQSVVATNLFSNNILQAITTRNYWDIVNEFKPLMHTWSLGIEEQYYIFYPILLLLVGKRHRNWLFPMLIILTIISLVLYLLPFKEYKKFYYLPFRFFELSLGGAAAIYFKDRVFAFKCTPVFVIGIILILFLDIRFLPGKYILLITVMLTLGVIAASNDVSKISSFILQNKISVGIGLISFSLYMWHQLILAYTRYFVVQKVETSHLAGIFILTVFLSAATYYFIEQPFRDKKKIRTGVLLSVICLFFVTTTFSALYIYSKGGVIRDVPELGLSKQNAKRGVHRKYNNSIFAYDKPFIDESNKIKILVIGDSFGRDWANVLLESKYSDDIDISYANNPSGRNVHELKKRVMDADIIFYSIAERKDVNRLGIDESKLFVIGTKNFGASMGYFYNYSGEDYFEIRTLMEDGYLDENERLRNEWGSRYIDLIARIIDGDNTVPVFTPDKMFISQDCRHFTKAGAVYFAHLFESELASLLDGAKMKR